MNNIQITLLLIILLSFSHCNSRRESSEIKSINISFLKGSIDNMNPYPCGELAEVKNSIKKDTIISTNNVICIIGNELEKVHKYVSIDSNSICDVRIECKINYKSGDAIRLCLGEFDCIVTENDQIFNSDTLSFFIKKYSGYYNYFSKTDLEYFSEIKIFGIPTDYRDLSNERKLDLID
jgi:hypothetical protein